MKILASEKKHREPIFTTASYTINATRKFVPLQKQLHRASCLRFYFDQITEPCFSYDLDNISVN